MGGMGILACCGAFPNKHVIGGGGVEYSFVCGSFVANVVVCVLFV